GLGINYCNIDDNRDHVLHALWRKVAAYRRRQWGRKRGGSGRCNRSRGRRRRYGWGRAWARASRIPGDVAWERRGRRRYRGRGWYSSGFKLPRYQIVILEPKDLRTDDLILGANFGARKQHGIPSSRNRLRQEHDRRPACRGGA